MMTKDDYLKRHIPHRVNLLITFRERFSNLTEGKMERLGLRDFYRCSKDISIMMVRFLLSELGINLKENNDDLSEKGKNQYSDKLRVSEVIKNELYENILKVLKAANRAVAHIEDKDVNHEMDSYQQTSKILIPVIDYTEQKIISNIYITEKAYQDAMSLDENKMNRKEIKTVNEK